MTPSKYRIYDLYKSLGLDSSKDLMTILENHFGVVLKSHSSTIDQAELDKVKVFLKENPPNEKGFRAKISEKKFGAKAAPVEAPKASAVPAEEKPSIDPSRVRVIKRAQQPPKPEVAEPAAAEIEQKPVIVDRKTPIVESKRHLLEGPAASSGVGSLTVERPVETSPAAPSGPATSTLKVGTVISSPDRERRPSSSQHPPSKSPAAAPGVSRPGDKKEGVEPGRATAAVQDIPVVIAPPKPDEKLSRRDAMIERSWTASEKPLPMPARRAPSAPRKTKRQIQQEKQDMIRQQRAEEEALHAAPKIISIREPITVSDLAKGLRVKETELIKHLFMKGVMVTVNQTLEVAFSRNVAKDFEFEIQEELDEIERATAPKVMYETLGENEKKKLDESRYKNLESRPPVVSIMGHVDHGKTTLLDAIRETRHKIVDQEAGGITQSIGAYTVEKNDQKIVFLDTPGHAAFTAMRMRGAKSTDIAILVVAADDGIMPQTIEAISHAKAAQIPIIVAVNKIDKEDADPDRVLSQLTEYGLASEKWGGETLTCEVSALQKVGLDEILDSILLVSELLNLKADSTVPAEGVIIEAQLDKRMGPVATALVQNGTLRVGDNVLIGAVGGRVRALIDDSGQRVQEAGPSMPVEILGLSSVPKAGETMEVITDDRKFKQLLDERQLDEREQRLNMTRKAVTPGFTSNAADGQLQQSDIQFNVVVKADTQGSLEAVTGLLRQMSTEEIKLNVLHQGTGDINEADVMLASASNALMIGFNVREDNNAEGLAKQQNIMVKNYDVIYHIAEDVEKLMLGKLSPDISEIESGRAEVRQLFKVGKSVIAGSMVTSGKLVRNSKATVLRAGKEIFTGTLDNLKRFKDDAKEVASGYECGISFDKFNDLQPGDEVVIYTVKETERTSL